MNGYLVDTNVLSEFSKRGDPDPRGKEWLASVSPASLYVSVLTLAEIRRGIELLPDSRRRHQLELWLEVELHSSLLATNILPVTQAIGDRWAVLSARAQAKGFPLATIDGLIAATAIEHQLTLATRNVKDFSGLPVGILNPWELS